MSEKHERLVFPDLFYCFVDFEPPDPITYIVPSVRVAEVVRDDHAAWLAEPGRGGRAHQDNKMRRIAPRGARAKCAPDGWMDEWRDRWACCLTPRSTDRPGHRRRTTGPLQSACRRDPSHRCAR